jgi:branched-chain amino acid transport system substrate-binding protein
MIRGVTDIGWKPEVIYVPQSSSSITFLEPAGLENAVGLVSNVSQKDVNDEQWSNDDDVRKYFAFMRQFLSGVDPHNVLYSFGYMNGHLLVEVLKACGDDLSKENIMRQAASLHKLRLPCCYREFRSQRRRMIICRSNSFSCGASMARTGLRSAI